MRHYVIPVLFLSACGGASGYLINGEEVSKDFFYDYEYIDTARALGDSAFDALLSGDEATSQMRFGESTDVLATSVSAHRTLAQERANTIAAVGGLALGAAAIAGSMDIDTTTAAGQAQFDGVWDAAFMLADFGDDLLADSVNVTSEDASFVERGIWRAPVVSGHEIAESVVAVRNHSKSGHCTGFFVSENVVATSAHCLDPTDFVTVIKQVPQDGEAFMNGNNVEVTATVAAYPSTYSSASQPCDKDDFVFLEVGGVSDSWLKISQKPARRGDRLFQLGYSGDLNDGFFMRIDVGCRIDGIKNGGAISHDCASYGGNSGGPVLRMPSAENQVAEVVGVHSCGVPGVNRVAGSKGAASALRAKDFYERATGKSL